MYESKCPILQAVVTRIEQLIPPRFADLLDAERAKAPQCIANSDLLSRRAESLVSMALGAPLTIAADHPERLGICGLAGYAHAIFVRGNHPGAAVASIEVIAASIALAKPDEQQRARWADLIAAIGRLREMIPSYGR